MDMRLRKAKTCRVRVAICGDNALLVDKTARDVLDFLRKITHKVSGPVALPVRTGDLEIPGKTPGVRATVLRQIRIHERIVTGAGIGHGGGFADLNVPGTVRIEIQYN